LKEAKRRLDEELWTEVRANQAYADYRARGRMKDGRRFGRPPDPYRPPDTPEGRGTLDSQWALLDQSMERARILGTDKIRVFAFTYKEKGGEKPGDKDFPRIVELVREASRRAKARNFRLALENVGGSYVSTGAEAARLLKAVKEDALGLTWDPNNAGASGERSFPDGFRLLDPARIIHVHLREPGREGVRADREGQAGDRRADHRNLRRKACRRAPSARIRRRTVQCADSPCARWRTPPA